MSVKAPVLWYRAAGLAVARQAAAADTATKTRQRSYTI